MERTCKRCGGPLPPNAPKHRLYCRACSPLAKKESSAEWQKAHPRKPKPKKKPEDEIPISPLAGMSLDEIALAASEAGMSYGQYVSMHKI